MKLLPAWIAALAILTSLVIVEGVWMVRMSAEWPRPVVKVEALPTPTPYHYMTVDEVLVQLEENFGTPPPDDFDARWEAYLKTPEGKRETALWDRWNKDKGETK